jgi:DNA polymerase delta subunit 1
MSAALREADQLFQRALAPGADTLEFCITSVDITDAVPPPSTYSRESMAGRAFQQHLTCEPPTGEATMALLYGATQGGESVLLQVHGFRPHVSFAIAPQFSAGGLASKLRRLGVRTDDATMTVTHVAKRAWGYDPPPRAAADDCATHGEVDRFREGTLVTFHVPTLRALRHWRYVGRRHFALGSTDAQLVEGRIDPITQFYGETRLGPCAWLCARVAASPPDRRISHSAIEARCGVRALQPLERDAMPEMLVLSFDGEMFSSRAPDFPDATIEGDFACTLSVHARWYGRPHDLGRNLLFCVGEADEVEGAITLSYESEAEMLDAFAEFCALCTPQFMTGFNQTGFDWPYLWRRQQRVGCRRFVYGGRLVVVPARLYEKQMDSAARGNNDLAIVTWTGVEHVDIMKEAQARYKMESYALRECCNKFLPTGRNKVDVPYDELFRLVALGVRYRAEVAARRDEGGKKNEGEEARRAAASEAMGRVNAYAKEDAVLPWELLDAMNILPSLFETSRVFGTPLQWLVMRGQQIKVMTQLYHESHALGHYLNEPVPQGGDDDDGSYVGATVLDPDPGFYREPVATLDFASLCALTRHPPPVTRHPSLVTRRPSPVTRRPSLRDAHASRRRYPSIMMAHNLCFSSLVVGQDARRLPDDAYSTIELPGERAVQFIKAEYHQGILPRILRKVLKARKAAKKAMQAAARARDDATTSDERAAAEMARVIQEQRQLALKVGANSIYGFCAANLYPCKVISEVVTAIGRRMIDKTKEIVEACLPVEIVGKAVACDGSGVPRLAHLAVSASTPGVIDGAVRTMAATGVAMDTFEACEMRQAQHAVHFRPRVIYGDTDSVMVLCPGLTVDECWRWGEIAAARVTDHFPGAIELEMEEVKWPYLLLKKKRYVARVWTVEDGAVRPTANIDYKGIELKRRDNAPCVKTVQLRVLLTLFAQDLFDAAPDAADAPGWVAHVRDGTMQRHLEGGPDRALVALQEEVGRIVRSELSLKDYVLSKTLRREYKNECLPHLFVVRLKEQRKKGSGDAPGSRVRYFTREKTPEEHRRPKALDKVTERSEDPEYAAAHGVAPDRTKYLMDIQRAVESIFQPFAEDRVAKSFDEAKRAVDNQRTGQTDIATYFAAKAASPRGGAFRPLASAGKRPVQAATSKPKRRKRA